MTKRCWAHVLGGCDSISGEHVFSKAVLMGRKRLPVVSLGGSARAPKGRFSDKAMKANVLCRKHNSQLSEVDAEAGRLMDYIEATNVQKKHSEIQLDGKLIERWAIKSFMNTLSAGWADDRKCYPDPAIVRTVFDIDPVPFGCGLYSVDGQATVTEGSTRHLSCLPFQATMTSGSRVFVGAFLTFNALCFLVALDRDVIQMLNRHPFDYEPFGKTSSLNYHYRPSAITGFGVDGVESEVRFVW